MRLRRHFTDTLKLRFARDLSVATETVKMNYCQAINHALRTTLQNNPK